MSNFNFRLYGDQIYGFCSGYFKDYISPEINKENFLTMFKEGKIEYDNIQIKQKFNIYPQICINSLGIQKIVLDIPDEKENLKVNLQDVTCEMIISNISENQIKEMLIHERKNLIDAFIKSSIEKITNKTPSKSFLDSILEKLINQALNGINIVINKLKLNIKCGNSTFLFSINDFAFDEKGRIIFNKISLFYEEDSVKYTVIPKFDINIFFKNNNITNNNNETTNSNNNTNSNTNNNNPNLLQMNMSDFSFELNQKIYFGILNLINCFTDAYYRRLYYKYKTLIQFHQIKNDENKKKDYKSLWLYAIKTIIKLQKYVGYDKRYIFNLLNSTQEKIVKKYFKYIKDNNNTSNELNDINLLYPNEINLLKGTKENVKQKVLDDKKGSTLSNAFSFFFFGGGGNNEKKNELSEEEIESLNQIYTDEYIINYLDNYDKINTDGNVIINKIKNLYSNLIIYIKIQKLELVLVNQNSSKKCDFYIKNINIELSHRLDCYYYNFYIHDICINQNTSICRNKRQNREPMIKFCKNKNNIELMFAFNNIELNENDFIYLLSFLYSIETPPKIKLFKPEDIIHNANKNKKGNENSNKNDDNNNSNLLRNFRISHIPSLTLICQGNKIDVNFYDFLLTDTYFCFTLNIKDSFGEIFPDYTFMINTIKEDNIYKFHLNMPIKFVLSKDSSKFFFLLYLKLQKVKEENKSLNKNIISYANDQLFGFKYTSYIKLDVEDIKQIGFDFLIDKTEIEINEEKCKSILLINNFSVKYENKNININIGKILLSTNKYSTIILYLFTFESPDYKDYEKLLNSNSNNGAVPLLNNSNNNNNNDDIPVVNDIAIVESFDYINIIENLFDTFNMNLKLVNFIYKADNNITTLTLKNIQTEKKNKNFYISIFNWDITLNILTPVQKNTTTLSKANKDDIETILNIKEKTIIDISLTTGIINIKIFNPVGELNMPIIQALDESYTFLIKQISLDYILCKLLLEISNTKVIFNQFNYIIENINLKNFTEVTNDTIFIKTKNIIMRNKEIDIIKEKGIDIDYQFKSSTENIITIRSNDLNINITQRDIYYLLLSLKPKKKENNLNNINEKENKDSLLTLTNNTTSTNFIENNLTPDFLNQINNNFKGDINTNTFFDLNSDFFMLGNNNTNTNTSNTNNYNNQNNEALISTSTTNNQKINNNEENTINYNALVYNNFFNDDNSPFNFINNSSNNKKETNNNNNTNKSKNKNKKKLIFDLKINSVIPCVNICLCLNDYTKISEFSVTSSSFEIKSLTTSVSDSGKDTNETTEIDYKISLGQLLLKYFDNNNNEIIMLNFEKNEKNDNKYSNQIEINYNEKEITINLNRNEVILRADSFLALYYYFKGSLPLNEIMDNLYQVEKININKTPQIQVNFNDSKFQLQTSFDGSENLHLDISSFVILYNSFEDGVFPYGNLFITLNTMSTTLISKNHSRKLFYTKNDFLYVQINNEKLNTNLEVRVGILIINLSYIDIISFLRAYFLNQTFFNNEKRLSNDKFLKNLEECNNLNNNMDKNNKTPGQTENTIIIPLEGELKVYKGQFKFEKLDITLIDNSTGSYYPFINLILNDMVIKYNKKILESSLSLILYSYNYISRVWEPTIEKVNLSIKYFEQDDATKSHKFIFDIEQILINLSDMSISFTLVSLNNWIQNYILAQKAYQESKMTIVGNNLIQFQSESSINNITKITNNKVINYTGMDLVIRYYNNEFKLEPNEEIALEYINKWDIKQYGPKQIILIYDNKIKSNIPIERIITLNHNIDKNFFLVSDNILSKDRQINITIYSPIIFKNKSRYTLQVKLQNSDIGDKILNFEPDSIFGIPFSYYNLKTKFCFILVNSKSSNAQKEKTNNNAFSSSFNLSEIMNTEAHQRYRKNIHLPNRKILLMKMKRQIGQMRTILIMSEYSIVNCLPCDIFVETDERGLMVEKCSQQYIDFYAGSGLEMSIKILANNEYFFSKKKKLFEIQQKKEGNYLKFRNKSNSQSFRLSLILKVSQNEKEKALIIYAESILHNNSGVLFDIKSKNKNKSKKTKTQLCFRINDNLFLISSKISNSVKDSYFMLINNVFQSKKIKLQEVMEASPYYKLLMTSANINDKLHDYILTLLIKRRMSYLYVENNPNFKENIMSVVYCILPICRITNLLKDKNFFVQDAIDKTKMMLVPPMKQIDFNFFNRGTNTKLNFGISDSSTNNSCQMSSQEFTLINYGIYTFCIGKNIFNLEIRESSSDGIIDIFIVETNLENGKIIVENLTDIVLTVYQLGFEKNQQIIKIQDKQILRLYDQNNPKFIFEIGNKASTFEFNSFEEEQSETPINNNIILFKESNGIKMNLKFYKIDVFNQFKSKISTLYFNFKINQIYISMIGDNEDKNERLDDYQRHEIMLFYLNGLNCSINWEQNLGLLGKDIITFNLALDKLELYNQLSQTGKFSLVFSNIGSPIIFLLTEMFYFKSGKVAKINKFEFLIQKIALFIDPQFINEILNFFQNIIYRMKIRNFNVDSVFLTQSNSMEEKEEDVYIKDNILCYGYNFDLPQLKIDFEITSFGLDQLLKQKLGCSFFYVWLANGLCGRKTSVNVTKGSVPDFVGKINGAIKTVYRYYKSKIVGEITSIGIKGFFGNFTKIFNFITNDKFSKDALKRKRPPRAFYDKYKCFKSYNETDSIYFEKIESKYSFLMNKLYYKNIIKGIKKVYLFTDSCLLVFREEDLEIIEQIKYIKIKDTREDKINIIINYNQKVDGKNFYKINCEDKNICHKINKILMEELDKIADTNYWKS